MKISEYYPKYLKAHKNIKNILLHFMGNVVTLWFICMTIACKWPLWFLIFSPFIIYFFAWPGHYFYEKNKPATFKVNPLITKICDWKMCIDFIRGKQW